MKVVYRADDAIMANLIAGMLENQGIQVQIRGEHLPGAFGELPVLGQVLVLVGDGDQSQAEAILARYDAGEIALPGDDENDWDPDSLPEPGT